MIWLFCLDEYNIFHWTKTQADEFYCLILFERIFSKVLKFHLGRLFQCETLENWKDRIGKHIPSQGHERNELMIVLQKKIFDAALLA